MRGKLNIAANISAGPIDIDQILKGAPGKQRRYESGSSKVYPVKFFKINEFTVAAKEAAYSLGKTVIDIPRLKLIGDQLTIIENSRLRINDLSSLITAANYKVDTAIKCLFVSGNEVRDLQISFKIGHGILTADAIRFSYHGFSTNIAGKLDLSRQRPNAKVRIESTVPDIRPLAARILPHADMSGVLKVAADITASDVRIKNLIETLQAVSQTDRPVEEEILPVKKAVINSMTVTAGQLNFMSGSTEMQNAKMELKAEPLPVIEKNKLQIKDFGTLWQKMRFGANIQISHLSIEKEKFSDIKTAIVGDRGSLKSDLIELNYFGARTRVAGILNRQDSLHHLKLRIEMPEVDLKKSFEEPGEPDLLEGIVSIQAKFEARTAYFEEILKKINGDFSIKGRNLVLKGVDLDKALTEFKKMRGYGFNAFSALVLLGPLGAVVSHGYDQLEALEKMIAAAGDSIIKQVVSDWSVSEGVLSAKDVAFSTQQNRVAVKGSLDLPNKKFNSIIIAVIDPKGCIVNSETVEGTFENPEIKDVSVMKRTIVRPLKRFFDTKCEFFYAGAVPHPSGEQPPSRPEQ